MSSKALREHSRQLAEFAAGTVAEALTRPDDWLLQVAAKSQTASAQQARMDAQRAEAIERGELVEFRFVGHRLEEGALPLDFLARLAAPLNNLLVRSAFFARTKVEAMRGAADDLSHEIALTLVGVAPGSTRLFIRGNSSPDTTGSAAFADGVAGVFDVLSSRSDMEQFYERLDDIGERAAEALHETLKAIEAEECSVQLRWHGTGVERSVDAPFDRVVQMRAMLEGFSDTQERQERLAGRVSLLAVNGRIQLELTDGQRASIRFKPKAQSALVARLTLNSQVHVDVATRVTHDPISGRDIKRYSLVNLEAPLFGLPGTSGSN